MEREREELRRDLDSVDYLLFELIRATVAVMFATARASAVHSYSFGAVGDRSHARRAEYGTGSV